MWTFLFSVCAKISIISEQTRYHSLIMIIIIPLFLWYYLYSLTVEDKFYLQLAHVLVRWRLPFKVLGLTWRNFLQWNSQQPQQPIILDHFLPTEAGEMAIIMMTRCHSLEQLVIPLIQLRMERPPCCHHLRQGLVLPQSLPTRNFARYPLLHRHTQVITAYQTLR